MFIALRKFISASLLSMELASRMQSYVMVASRASVKRVRETFTRLPLFSPFPPIEIDPLLSSCHCAQFLRAVFFSPFPIERSTKIKKTDLKGNEKESILHMNIQRRSNEDQRWRSRSESNGLYQLLVIQGRMLQHRCHGSETRE